MVVVAAYRQEQVLKLENVAQLKTKTEPARPDTFVKPKTPQVTSTSSTVVKRKNDEADDTAITAKKSKVSEDNIPTSTKSKGLPIDFFDDESDSSEEEMEAPSTTAALSSTSKLPADFFDSSVSSNPTTEESSATPEDKESTSKDPVINTAEALPEGFFDDPVMDAKVRKVEVKDPMTEEWEKFKKTIAEETNVSEAIQEEEDEERQRERQIDEIDEQIHCLQKVEKLRDKKDEILTKTNDKSGTTAEDDSSNLTEEAEFEEFLDWRSKGAWR
ncbi:zinc finger protein 830-like [Ptychodera flava]|uniref:zinc finger protein 830-like n=1 Tax=Ptychodera flava TaxID=63121 RepID=UPI00396A8152